MEVLAFVVKYASIKELLKEFLSDRKDLYLEAKDIDTFFFNKKGSTRHEIYFHDYFNNVDEELSLNYSQEEQEAILKYFGSKVFFMFGIQYRNGDFLEKLLNDFKEYIKKKGGYEKASMLLFHPFRGIIKW